MTKKEFLAELKRRGINGLKARKIAKQMYALYGSYDKAFASMNGMQKGFQGAFAGLTKAINMMAKSIGGDMEE
ncbi:hypothetical protein [Christensenella tenuis]|uniref:Uncharacterized protein n=1 Tax=Christensenella tenuis TaxID=2763033 RepID=A0ABR7EEM1_9FIRM|nr:hypothetical protein [Christensenella tenuis]MBC5647539.1 hypothetical protein [Christensenella tenuis]